jgi:hypothetical protein
MNQKPSERIKELDTGERMIKNGRLEAIVQYLDEQWEKEQRFSTPEHHRVTVEGITNL